MTKLEKVARAIMANINHDPDYEECMEAARAAVEELRKVSDGYEGLTPSEFINDILNEKPE